MKKYYLPLLAVALLSYSCGPKATNGAEDHAGHDHGSEASACSSEDGHNHEGHNHEAEGHDHEAEGHEGHNHGAEAAEKSEHIEGEIVMKKAQAAELGLEYTTVAAAPFAGAIRTWGVVEPAPGDAVNVAATMSGMFDTRLAVGQRVSKGQLLGTINGSTLSQGNSGELITNARAELRRWENELSRVQTLLRDQLATQSEYQQALASKEQAAATLRALTSGTSEGGVRRVVSPMTGYVTALDVSNGDYVEQGARMLTISANQKLVVRADVPQRHAAAVSSINGLNFKLENSPATYSSKELVAGGHAAAGGAISMRFAVDNRAEILPGAVVEAFLLGKPQAGVIAVPLSALTDEQGQKFVYLKMGPETYLKRHVTLGQSDGQQVEILSGLKTGETVVSRGAYFVRLASSSGAVPHGHSH